jgi:hypothetical protein
VADIISIGNIYQLLAFLIVAGLQIWTKRGVNKLAADQAQLRVDIETARGVMFRRVKPPNGHALGSEGHVASVAATIEAALKVAYLYGKADGGKPDAAYPHERIAHAARQLAEHAILGREPVSLEDFHAQPATVAKS